jgi:hypothetical protein
MIVNWFNTMNNRRRQFVTNSSCCSFGDAHTTDLPSPFLSPFIRFFLTLPPSPCGYCTCLIMMQNVPFSPNLYTTAWQVWSFSIHFTIITLKRNDLRDLRASRTCKLTFPSAGWCCWGWVYNKISKWIPNGYGLKFTLNQLTFESFDSFLWWINKCSISNRLRRTVGFLKIFHCNLI